MINKFKNNQNGNIAILTAFVIVILTATLGAGVDFGRAYLVKTKFQQASDMAALAAATITIASDDTVDSIKLKRMNTASQYFAFNVPQTYLGLARPVVATEVTDSYVKTYINTSMPTSFLTLLDIKNINIVVGTTSNLALNKKNTYDVILAMDNSGSMAEDFAGNTKLKPGVQTRLQILQQSATSMATQLLKTGIGNRMSAITWTTRVEDTQLFTTDYNTYTNFLNRMKASGGTDSTIGMQAAQTMSQYYNKTALRVVILLTDGENSNVNSNAQTQSICTQFKMQSPPTLVYTIAVGVSATNNNTVKNFLSSCASGTAGANLNQYFFVAPSGDQLQTVFSQITSNIQKLRIAE